jgi:hypothetical protein
MPGLSTMPSQGLQIDAAVGTLINGLGLGHVRDHELDVQREVLETKTVCRLEKLQGPRSSREARRLL